MANYGLFLSVSPPEFEVRIAERTSWSCAHGVERWRSNCGCGSEIKHGYNQSWRGPLRAAMNSLADSLSEVYLSVGATVFEDPGAARDLYPTVMLTNKDDVRGYVRSRAKSGLPPEGGEELLEMVDSSAMMLASCAWFWEDISRIETVQMLRFAARGIELGRKLGKVDLEPEFRRYLAGATPNDRRFKTGADLYDRLAKPESPN